MINKLKRKFLIIGTVFMFILMTVLVLIMNIVNYCEVISESDQVMDVLAQPELPMFIDKDMQDREEDRPDMIDSFIPRGMSREVPYESRFFVVNISNEGKIIQSDLSRIISVDDESSEEYINKAMASRSTRGFIGNFRYLKVSDRDVTRIIFLDCGRRLDSFRTFLIISVLVGLGGCIVVFIAFVLTAGKIVSPIAESYEKQKRFISDAGHEIKTPLTIINANVDLLESDGEKEELDDIRQQTGRLTELTNNLILLSKMEESGDTMKKIEFPLSDLVTETANSFRAPAASNGLTLNVNTHPGITANGSPDSIRQLVSILMDNAIKYSPHGGEVTLEMEQHRKSAVISVTNSVKDKINEADLPRVFDRFYRTDASRNSQTGGHGIGLSVAKAIVSAHGGSISAATKDGTDFRVTAVIPL